MRISIVVLLLSLGLCSGCSSSYTVSCDLPDSGGVMLTDADSVSHHGALDSGVDAPVSLVMDDAGGGDSGVCGSFLGDVSPVCVDMGCDFCARVVCPEEEDVSICREDSLVADSCAELYALLKICGAMS